MRRLLCAALSLAWLGACSSSGVPDSTELNSKVSDIWQVTGGVLFSDDFNGNLRYMALETNGEGTFYREVGETGIITCETFLYSVTGDSRFLLDRGDAVDQGLTQILAYSISGNDFMTITATEGTDVVLTKAEAVPEANVCQTLERAAEYTYGVTPLSGSNLVYDGAVLWFSGYDGVDDGRFPITPWTGELGAISAFPDNFLFRRSILAMQGTDFWNNEAAGDNNPIRRYTAGNVLVDEIHTKTDLASYIDIRGAGFDGTNLWLFGTNRDDETSKFLKVDSNAEPDTLLATFDYPSAVVGNFTFEGGFIWALVRIGNGSVAKIDPATMKALKTYVLPKTLTFDRQGIAKIGDEIFVLGTVYDDLADSTVVETFSVGGGG